MRKALILLLLASAAAPAFASTEADGRIGRRDRAERAALSDDGERAQRPARVERAERPARAERVERAEHSGRREAVRPQLRERLAPRGDYRGSVAPAVAPAAIQASDAPDSVRDWRRRERFRENSPTVIQERNRNGAEVIRDRAARRAPAISRIPRQGTQPPARTTGRRYANFRWRDDWRSDRRYDWRSHRRRYGSLFHFGFYRDPFGWGYQPFSIGWRMWPSYYSRSYWLDDPWQYRLPYAPPGYRWIRYYDDAILVDTWDGQVVDVIRNFFW